MVLLQNLAERKTRAARYDEAVARIVIAVVVVDGDITLARGLYVLLYNQVHSSPRWRQGERTPTATVG